MEWNSFRVFDDGDTSTMVLMKCGTNVEDRAESHGDVKLGVAAARVALVMGMIANVVSGG